MPSAAERYALCMCVWRVKQVYTCKKYCSHRLRHCNFNCDVLSVYQALSLEQLTATEFLCKLSEKVGLKPGQVSCVLQLTNSGLLVMVDDTV